MNFTPVRPDEIEMVAGFMEQFYGHERITFDRAVARRALGVLLETPRDGQAFLVRTPEGEIAGYLVITFGFSLEFGGRFALLDELFVRERFRRRGIGAAALAFAGEICRREGMSALRLEVDRANGPAQALYRAGGFEDHGRDFLTRACANPRARERK